MKNKLQLNNKTSLKQKLVFASLGFGLIVLVGSLGFLYLNLGNGNKSKAAGGHAPCNTTFYTSTGESMSIQVEAVRFSELTCYGTGSYNYNIEFRYDINYSPSFNPIIYDLKGFFTYEGTTFEFPLNNRTQGTHITNTYTASVPKNCTTANLGLISNMQIFVKSDRITEKTSACSEVLLPISLIDFKAKKKDEAVIIDWTTGSEINNDFFTLEHSIDGKVFENIATIEGAGNSVQLIDYKFEDKHPDQGMNYYRLKQTDYNGDFEYFKIVAVNFGGVDPKSISSNAIIVKEAYPNPFKNEIKLDFELSKAENIKVIIQNARGEVLYQEAISTNLGANNYTFTRADELKSGIYYINLKSDSENFKPQRIVKL